MTHQLHLANLFLLCCKILQLAGATYMDIHNAGGGIGFTVERVRKASEEELYTSLRKRLLRMLRSGTTLVEAKSGYGLEVESEMKMLRVIERAKKELPIEISSTFCGAHSVPKYVLGTRHFSWPFYELHTFLCFCLCFCFLKKQLQKWCLEREALIILGIYIIIVYTCTSSKFNFIGAKPSLCWPLDKGFIFFYHSGLTFHKTLY